MSYVFLPPRTTNYFPAGFPYLAGLGDYASDLEAWKKAHAYYKADYKRWHAEKTQYEKDLAAYNQAASGAAGAYASAKAQYDVAKGKWDADYQTYLVAMAAYNKQVEAIRAQNRAKAQQVAKNYGIALATTFLNGDACITQAQKDAYMKQCRSGTVKGLGSSDTNCAFAAMPVCSFPAKPTLRSPPTPPVKPTLPAAPKLRPMPVEPIQPTAPIVTTTPVTTPTTTPTTTSSNPGGENPIVTTTPTDLTPEDNKQANLVMGGLIVAAVLGGGYLVYRTLKKPKAQA